MGEQPRKSSTSGKFSVYTVHIEEELDRRDGKGRQCCLGDVYLKMPHCSDLAARMI